MGYNLNTCPNMEKNNAEKRALTRDATERIVARRSSAIPSWIKFSEVMYTTSGRKQSTMLRPNKHSGFEANHGRIMKRPASISIEPSMVFLFPKRDEKKSAAM